MVLPLPHISDQTTNDAWSYRATQQINQNLNRIDLLENRAVTLQPVIQKSANAFSITVPDGSSATSEPLPFLPGFTFPGDLNVEGTNTDDSFTLDPITNEIITPANGTGLYRIAYNITIRNLPTGLNTRRILATIVGEDDPAAIDVVTGTSESDWITSIQGFSVNPDFDPSQPEDDTDNRRLIPAVAVPGSIVFNSGPGASVWYGLHEFPPSTIIRGFITVALPTPAPEGISRRYTIDFGSDISLERVMITEG